MSTYILTLGADLFKQRNSEVLLGPESARVCEHTAHLVKNTTAYFSAFLLFTAGYSEKYRIIMGVKMLEWVESCLGKAKPMLDIPATEFSTAGEIFTALQFLQMYAPPDQKSTLVIVVRWWHLPRAAVLAYYFRRKFRLKDRIRISMKPAPSRFTEFYKNIVGLREPFAWMKMMRRMMFGFKFPTKIVGWSTVSPEESGPR